MKTMIISSNCSGGGKTTFTLGLMKALKNRNYDVQGYKVGPDYIDTGFHTEITGKVSRNLDLHIMGEEGVKASFSRGKGDLAVVEGVMGLYDGKGLDEECSTYSVSKVLDDSPIILVITPKAQSVTLCAEINGIKNFRNANIVGVVLNCVSESFYSLLKPAIEMHCGLKVFGYVPKDDELKLESRHLGLVQSVEVEGLNKKINYLAELIEKYINLDEIIESFKDVKKFEDNYHLNRLNKKIAIAYDEAFRFYYKENLELLEEVGEVVYFSPIRDKKLPENIDFLYLGGGYPEVFKDQLSKNTDMLRSIKEALDKGLNCYAECGGLMYLTENIDSVNMVGFFKGNSEMTKRLNRFGYATLDFNNIKINCHEFHKSKVNSNESTVYDITKTTYAGDKVSWKCGYKKKNTLAGYPHVHFFGNIEFIKELLK
ncbi:MULTISPECIES: cobyrinate a,c-diamide synthase [unclassified Clostridium]|uniref:cobyrinate a,c-diamide synthase n=1 Tax=unclassified Clostridium TaxID=2614128 RepID=UPI001C8C1A5F|nr:MULTISPECIES: cobyrinate a,c-diamide synthase [unclassified Clostridium]MBX9138574.1 cobyrinate a,c-diamide synthase [Clostridium sp. K12(2020)]MBX9145354.1 cobyrinate a,c-diamide synthase [Clostridium sp. K13]MDU4327264.1 cobyrinate a,c-diamide synthase [Clostridium celatum]